MLARKRLDPPPKIPRDWCHEPFVVQGKCPVNFYSKKQTARQVKFLLDKVRFTHKPRTLDLGCGEGRISIPLAEAGWNVTGFDVSTRFLRRASAAAKAAHVPVKFITGNMYGNQIPNNFDAVLSIFASFGFSLDPADDSKLLGRIYKSLNPNGLLFIDSLPLDVALNHLDAVTWHRGEDGRYVLSENWIDQEDGAVITRWTILKPRCEAIQGLTYTRLYTKQLLGALLQNHGFKPEGWWGDYDGSELGTKSSHIMVLARKIE